MLFLPEEISFPLNWNGLVSDIIILYSEIIMKIEQKYKKQKYQGLKLQIVKDSKFISQPGNLFLLELKIQMSLTHWI